MTIAAGSLLSDRYHLDRALGEGSFAQVYLATDRRLNRQVAVKVLKPELAAQRDFLRRFTLEAQRVAELDHPNILSIFDYGEAEGTVFLVMPYSEGGTLADRLQRGILGGGSGTPILEETARYLAHAAAALDFAHARGIVHGDVKPQNMLLRDDGKWLLLTDFGLAKLLNVASRRRTPIVVGSSAYMAPEQFQGGGDQAADIYALGCVLFELLTGEVPYTGTPEQIEYGHVLSGIPSVVTRSQGKLPKSFQTVIERALAKQPTARYPTAGALAEAFQSAAAPVAAGAAQPPPSNQSTGDQGGSYSRSAAGRSQSAPVHHRRQRDHERNRHTDHAAPARGGGRAARRRGGTARRAEPAVEDPAIVVGAADVADRLPRLGGIPVHRLPCSSGALADLGRDLLHEHLRRVID